MAVLAGICALGVALSPTSIDKAWMDELATRGYILTDFPGMSLDDIDTNRLGHCDEIEKDDNNETGKSERKCTLSTYPITPTIHMFCAITLFFVLIGFCLNFIIRTCKKLEKLADRTGTEAEMTRNRIRWRRRLYWFSAVLILLSGALAIAAAFGAFGESVKDYAVMIAEFGCLKGFAISWFVSGAGVLRGNDAEEVDVTVNLDKE